MYKSFEVVPFHEHEILAVREDREVLVPLKPIVETLGLAWNAQFERVKRHPVLSEGIRVTRIPSHGGMQETTALTLEMVSGFLTTIQSERIKDADVRARVVLFQREAFHALFVHFFGDRAGTGFQASVPTTADLLRLVSSVKNEAQPEIRAMLHKHLGNLCERLDLPLPAIEAFGLPAPSGMDVANAFFAALLELRARGIEVDHHRNPEMLAVSLPGLRPLLRDAGIECPPDRALWKALPQHPAFESNGTVNCSDGKGRHCWIFDRSKLSGFSALAIV